MTAYISECHEAKPSNNNEPVKPIDYTCDFCGKPESEVGNLYCGRNRFGRDFQICHTCKTKLGIEKIGDVEQHYIEKGRVQPK